MFLHIRPHKLDSQFLVAARMHEPNYPHVGSFIGYVVYKWFIMRQITVSTHFIGYHVRSQSLTWLTTSQHGQHCDTSRELDRAER